MGKYDGYHTALAPEPFKLPSLDRVEFRDGVAIRHDLFSGSLPDEFQECDVLYAELPWRKGFTEFERRVDPNLERDYHAFLDRVRSTIEVAGKPAVIITGRHAVKRLAPQWSGVANLNGEDMLAISWNCGPISGSTPEILDMLAMKYDCLGDFCCGYGSTAKAARKNGKRFVISDFNGSCIRYIANEMGLNS